MNEDTAFKRVRIRKILLPLLEDMNPNIIETLANTASLMQKIVDGSFTGNSLSRDRGALDLKELRTVRTPIAPARSANGWNYVAETHANYN
jgi:hypothetical protein